MQHPFQYVLYKEQDILAVLNDLANVYQEAFHVDDKTRDRLIWRVEKRYSRA